MKFSALALEHVSKVMTLRLLIFIAILWAPSLAMAQSPKIAIVDIEKLSSQSMAGQSIQKQLRERRTAFQKEFSARENNLMNSEKQLIEEQKNLSADEFSLRRKEFETQLLETRNLFQSRRNALDKGVSNALAQLRKTIIEVTAEIAEKQNFSVVLTRESVVIIEAEMDITDQVMTAMNARLSTIPLRIDE